MNKNQKGFTLIELLVVIAIIAVLASIVLVSLNTARVKGRDARRVADIKSIQNALELYYDANSNTYPTALSALAPTYIPAVPQDPKVGVGAYSYAYTDTATQGVQKKYHIGTIMEGISGSEGALAADRDLDIATAVAVDWSGEFDGTSGTCATTDDSTTDRCYDVTN